jgi:hypothetical protein
MSERGEGREGQEIHLARINSRGELEYTEPVLAAFESMLDRQRQYPSTGEITMADPKHLFAAEYKTVGQDKFWTRSYYHPHRSEDPKEPIIFKPNLDMTLHRGFWSSGIRASYYPEDTSLLPQRVNVGLSGLRFMAEVDLYSPDRLSVDWVVDGVVGGVGLGGTDTERSKNAFLDPTSFLRDKLDLLYKGETDMISMAIPDEPGVELETTLDPQGDLIVRRRGGHPTRGYLIKSHMTQVEKDEIIAKMATPALLEHPGTAPITEDIWKGLDILPTFGIKVLPPEK